MKVVTGEQMKALDQKTIKGLGIPGVVLMENAGRGVVENMLGFYEDLYHKRIGICCGGGNNGGDGCVVARHLMNMGMRPEVFLFADPKRVCGDAKTNLDVLFKMGAKVYVIMDVNDMDAYKEILEACDILVDAIFGTGLRPPVTGFLGDVIETIAGLKKAVVAVDIPSGLGSDSSKVAGPCIKADLTVTFGLPKTAHLIPPAMDYVGELRVWDIGIPGFLVEEAEYDLMALDKAFVSPFVKTRRPDSHKGSYGHCLIIAGSKGFTGAAYLAAQSALRIGAGLVTLAIPESLNSIMEVKLTEAMTIPLPETDSKSLSLDAWPILEKIVARIDAIAIGPGMSQHPDTGRLVQKVISDVNLPMVIDADALNLISGRLDLIKQCAHSPVLTPHPGEMARLLGIAVTEVLEDRMGILEREAALNGCYLVLKGYQTLMSNPEGRLFVNTTGNPGMASGGMGDVLTGMIAGLLAQGYTRQEAMLLGVYLHGLAADIAKETKGEEGLIATDLFDALPKAIRSLR